MRSAFLLFGVMALAQWLLPWWTVRGQERVLREGTAFKFRTAPVDPHDPFRGEYVMLRFALEDEEIPSDPAHPFAYEEQVFVVLREQNGEAAIAGVQRERPASNAPYIACLVHNWMQDSTSTGRIELPFDRFYLEEGKGARTEELVRQGGVQQGVELPSYTLVRVLEGEAVLEDLIVGDRSIHAWITE
jgi:uncharacterized membrane-anchored protein